MKHFRLPRLYGSMKAFVHVLEDSDQRSLGSTVKFNQASGKSVIASSCPMYSYENSIDEACLKCLRLAEHATDTPIDKLVLNLVIDSNHSEFCCMATTHSAANFVVSVALEQCHGCLPGVSGDDPVVDADDN